MCNIINLSLFREEGPFKASLKVKCEGICVGNILIKMRKPD